MATGDTRDDRLLDGRLLLRQPVRGHRAGTDALLLAAAAPPGDALDVVDLGAGVGAVGLAVALQEPSARVRLVELDAATAALARHNVLANALDGRVSVIEADILARPAGGLMELAPCSADVVLTNPPFDAPGRGRPSPDAARRRAHVMDDGGLERWILAALDLLRAGGTLVCIHRATALPALLRILDRRFGAVTVRPVTPRAGSSALRVIVRATAGSRGPFALLPPLVLHDENGAFTPQADALHRGRERLAWT